MATKDRLPKADKRPSAIDQEGIGGAIEGIGAAIEGAGYGWPKNDG